MIDKLKVMFMGTPDFAVPSLKMLYETEEVAAVITRADKPKGRHMTLTPPPVKAAAIELGIPVYQPATLKDEAFADLLKEINPDIIIVAAFGKILPESVLSYPRFGCVNVHGSLLPEYRGAAPMQRAIMDGKSETGITIMKMNAGIDTGDMYLKAGVPIGENDNFEAVHDALAELGAKLLREALRGIKAGTLEAVAQDSERATYAPKIEKDEEKIDFRLPAASVHNKIRALSPYPLAFCLIPDGSMLKITSSVVRDTETSARPGTILHTGDVITVACGKGAIDIHGVLPEGRGRMSAADFVRGRRIAEGQSLF